MLHVEALEKHFGGLRAVNGATFHVQPGVITALIGPNGSGKTTTFDLITGNVRPNAGVVRFGGRDITGLSPWQVARLGLGRTFQLPRLFGEMTVLENMTAAVREGTLREVVHRALDLLGFVGLTAPADAPASARYEASLSPSRIIAATMIHGTEVSSSWSCASLARQVSRMLAASW